MTNFISKQQRFTVVAVATCLSLFILVAYNLLSSRTMWRYLWYIMPQKSLDTIDFAFTASEECNSMLNTSIIGCQSILTTHDILNTKNPELISPNGRFILRLEPSGNLRYLQILEFPQPTNFEKKPILTRPQRFEKSLFFTSTGDSWTGEHMVELTSNGELRVRARPPFMTNWKTTWSSGLLAHCKKSKLAGSTLTLSVHDSGMLAIYSRNQNTFENLCILHPEVIYHSDIASGLITTSSKGKRPRLAMVIAGFFRTNTATCRSHMEKIIKKWQDKHNSSVDVFIFTYVENAFLPGFSTINVASITAALQACYKDNLKSVRVRSVKEVEETFSGVNPSEIKQCGPKLHQLQSQLKTVYFARQLMRNYMLSEGITYDYILRLRPDTDAWGDIPDLPIFGIHDDETRIFLPHPYREHYYWCANHDGRIRTGVTDQLAYGTLPVMQTYLNMYLEFSDMVRVVTGQYENVWKKAKYNTMGCEGTVSENGCDWSNADTCSIECLVSYYLVLHGLEPEILWTWQQNVVRRDGRRDKHCGQAFNC